MYQHLIPDYPVMEVVQVWIGLCYSTNIKHTAHWICYCTLLDVFSQAQSFVKKRGLRVNSWKFQVFRLAGANAFSDPSQMLVGK